MRNGGIKLPATRSCLKRSAIHLASFLSVFLPRIAFTYFGWASVIWQVSSRILYTGIQYLPVDSMQTYVQELEQSHWQSFLKPFVKVEKRLDLYVVTPLSFVEAMQATIKFLWTSIPQHTG